MSQKWTYDIYHCTLPIDLFGPEPEDGTEEHDIWKDQIAEHAIGEARDRARLYCIPALWYAHVFRYPNTGEVMVRVVRKRHKPHPNPPPEG